MRLFSITLLVLCLACSCMAWNPKEYFDQYADKVGHFGIGGTVAGFSVLKLGASPGSALLNTVIVGFAKEQFDQNFGGHADIWDFIFTIAGGVLIAL